MRKLLNTLYVTTESYYLSLDGENIVVLDGKSEVGRIPLHNLESIICFCYKGVSPALMGACVNRNIALSFLTPHGNFQATIIGKTRGNVVLRKSQYRISEDKVKSLGISRNCIMGKVFNCRWVLERMKRDHGLQVDVKKLERISEQLQQNLQFIREADSEEQLRGYEGAAASLYFSAFDDLILQQKKHFHFHGRNRRPPLDNVNALLSFSYTLLTGMMTSALETVGLDPAVGFMHGDRPGRNSLALDMVEELRPVIADRFVLFLINKRIVSAKDFTTKENGAVFLNEEARKTVLTEWQKRKQPEIRHPYLEDKVQWGMVPYVQSMLLARHIRGDIEAYPPFFWK